MYDQATSWVVCYSLLRCVPPLQLLETGKTSWSYNQSIIIYDLLCVGYIHGIENLPFHNRLTQLSGLSGYVQLLFLTCWQKNALRFNWNFQGFEQLYNLWPWLVCIFGMNWKTDCKARTWVQKHKMFFFCFFYNCIS